MGFSGPVGRGHGLIRWLAGTSYPLDEVEATAVIGNDPSDEDFAGYGSRDVRARPERAGAAREGPGAGPE